MVAVNAGTPITVLKSMFPQFINLPNLVFNKREEGVLMTVSVVWTEKYLPCISTEKSICIPTKKRYKETPIVAFT
jgi:hypothetical protein